MPFSIYMIVPGAAGESTVAGLKDIHGRAITQVPFEVYSFSLGESNPVTFGSGGGAPTAGNIWYREDADTPTPCVGG